jgi:hypothetical protein
VVSYTSPSRASGFVFTIFITKKNQRPVFNIQNNAKFIRTKKYPDGVNFIEDPLGGIWTQEHLVSAIKRIENQPQFEISEPELQQASALEGCHAYADSFVDRK